MRTLLLVLLLVAACSQPQLLDEPRRPTTPPVAGPPTAYPEPAAQPSARAELEALLDRRGARYTITYATREENPEAVLTGEITLVADDDRSANRQRLDTPDGTFENLVIIDDEVVICGKNVTWSCFSLPKPPDEEVALPGNVTVTRAAGETILGRVAACYQIIFANGVTTECYDEDGVLLRSETHAQQVMARLDATKYVATVEASAFVPPAPVEPLS